MSASADFIKTGVCNRPWPLLVLATPDLHWISGSLFPLQVQEQKEGLHQVQQEMAG